MRSRFSMFVVLLMAASPLFGSHGAPMPQVDPKNEAVNSYNDGLRYRDRAWGYEKELAAATDPAKRTKLEEQIRKTYAADVRCQRAAIKNNSQLFQAYSELGYALRKSGSEQELSEEQQVKLLVELQNRARTPDLRRVGR